MKPRVSLAALFSLVLMVLLSYGDAAWPQSRFYGSLIIHGQRNERLVALSFDDGPNDPYTTQILDILDRYNAKATFFLVGANVERQPETARRIVADGHAIGNHSYRHQRLDGLLDIHYREAERAQHVITGVTGVAPTLYRPPNGFHTPWQLITVRRLGLQPVTWDVAVRDWQRPAPDTIARRVVARVRPGSIVLLHDGNGTHHSDQSRTVEALPLIIEPLQARGYRFVTVPELVQGSRCYNCTGPLQPTDQVEGWAMRLLPDIGFPELVVILLVLVMVFGVGRLPELGAAIGKAIREFRRASTGDDEMRVVPGAPREVAVQSRLCEHCHAPLAPGARFCMQCGASVGGRVIMSGM